MSGFVLLHRDVYDHPAFNDAVEASAFVWMFTMAQWKDAEIKYRGKKIALKRGQIAVSVRDLAKKFGWSEPKCRRFLNRLADGRMIEKKATHLRRTPVRDTDAPPDAGRDASYTTITICNYDKYQTTEKPSDAPPDAGRDAPPTHPWFKSDAQNNKENKDKEFKEQIAGADAPAGKYAFSGKTARLTGRDFAQWCQSYAGGSRERLMAWMQERDDWLSGSRATDSDRKNWFHSTSSWLRRKSLEYSEKAERTAAQKVRDRPMVRMTTAEMDLLMSGEPKG